MIITRRTMLLSVPVAAAAVTAPVAFAGSAAAATVQAGQSPIDIPFRQVRSGQRLAPLELDYGITDLQFEYISKDGVCSARAEEETVQAAVPPGAAGLTLDGTRYDLLQFHFHTRSEHTLNGRRFAAEQHFVHRSADGRLLVLGVLLTNLRRGGAVDAVLDELPEECGPEITLSGIDLAAMVPTNLAVIRYGGSLTTPPFGEGVNWNVSPFPMAASRRGLRRLQRLFPDGNSRAVQPLAGRDLRLVPGAH